MVRKHGMSLATVFRIALSVMRFLIPLGMLLLVMAVSCAAPEASQVLLPQAEPEELPSEASDPSLPQPEPPLLPSAEEVFSALDTEVLLDIGYNDPDRIVTVEGTVMLTFYATESKGKPTFIDFHDPYQGWFMCIIWEEDRESSEPIREKFVAAFPPNLESYFLDKRVRVRGRVDIYQGTPEMVLTEPSQIWTVDGASWYQALVVRVVDGDTVEIEGEIHWY